MSTISNSSKKNKINFLKTSVTSMNPENMNQEKNKYEKSLYDKTSSFLDFGYKGTASIFLKDLEENLSLVFIVDSDVNIQDQISEHNNITFLKYYKKDIQNIEI
jgi:hypothetical protein